MEKLPEVTALLNNTTNWKEEMLLLRELLLSCGLTETVKWRQACYMFGNQNVVILSSFKNYCALNFFKGSLLKDELGLLTKAGEHTQGGRQMRFSDLSEIQGYEAEIKTYIFEAIEVEKAGLKVENTGLKELKYPLELSERFKLDSELKDAFLRLTPGRQRAYIMHFSEAKQAATRMNRIDKMRERILKGKGMNDCICGLSKRMPNCDGSHKMLR